MPIRMHIFGNMIFLFVFGDDIEDALGHWRFLLFYLACGLGADAAFVLSDPTSNIDLIGASGAVAGVISAYLLYRPCAKVTALLGLIPLRLRAYWLIGLWVILQIGEIASNAPGWRCLLGAYRRPDHRRGAVRPDAARRGSRCWIACILSRFRLPARPRHHVDRKRCGD